MAPKANAPVRKKRPGPSPPIDPASSPTPQSLEQELKSLAAKAHEDTWSRSARAQFATYARVVLLLTLAAASANASRAALSPLYGAIPAAIWHRALVAAACFAGWSSNLHLRRLLPAHRPLRLWMPVLAAYVPAVQFVLGQYASSGSNLGSSTDGDGDRSVPWLFNARWGPVLTEALSLFPLVVVAAAYALASPSRLLWYAVPALLHTALRNTHLAPAPWALAQTNRALASVGGEAWAVLDRGESVTGYLAVLENRSLGFRVLRCDHSLLGGEWVLHPVDPVAEPIYSVFVMLEAVRLVDVPGKAADADARALVIGLGVGTAPAALVAHGIDTTVVEIDPLVHAFAAQYFHLPANHTIRLEDAVGFTAASAQDPAGPRYDYILHDVFTGGAEPIPLFTLEFLQHLHTLLTPTGVIAINYAGDFNLTPIKAVVHTIRTVFPNCRIFREHAREDTKMDAELADFANVVIFCTKSGGGTSNDGASNNSDDNNNNTTHLTFREPNESDFLNSIARRHFMVPKHEVHDTEFSSAEPVRPVRNNDTEQLARWHDESALGHWSVMRVVIPAKVWAMW
ncbi:Spermine synthase [Niveomyces insectorum RCEF 264]|uniref:Spermine synthase n=1 Tax=Niveomyces insectorum RCEF 264 TaxID=1081102 RepID=A0A167ZCH0_9HYPO|nr:Spermine synthase [Niveomyces insectorum RCEF 264]